MKKSKKLLVLSTLFLSFGLTACGEQFPSHVAYEEGDNGEIVTPFRPYDNGKRIESISFKENDVILNLSKEGTYQIEASFAPSDAANPKLAYVSSDESIAKVDEDGKVSLVGPGAATIVVSSDTGVSADFRIKGIIPPTAISIAPHFADGGTPLDINDTKQFAIVTEPENATEKDVVWSITDEEGNPTTLASISETGLVSINNAKKADDIKFVVHAVSKVDSSLTAEELIRVNDERIYAESVGIFKDGSQVSDIDVYLNEPVQLDAVTVPEVTTADKVNWESFDTSIATVDEGLVSAVKAPAATKVKATVDGELAEVNVNTKKIDVTDVTLDKSSLTLNKGETYQLEATVLPVDASVKDIIFTVSEGNDYVTVNEDGLVSATKATGDEVTAKVTAVSKDNSEIFAECLVTVTNKVSSIKINNPYDKMYYGGETYTLSLDKEPYDCEDFDVTWTSSNTSIATVNDGVITTNTDGLTGQVTITAEVDGTDIGDFIDIDIIKPAEPFTEGNMYLVGNRNFNASGIDYDHASWDDSDYALAFESAPDEAYKNQWKLLGVHLERYDQESGEGDQFKVRSADWPEFSLDPASTKSVYFTEEGNLVASNSENYDLYFKEAYDGSFSLYIMSEFARDTYYVVGSRDFSSGVATGIDASWHDVSKAYAMEYDAAGAQYHAAVTFDEGDEFKVRRDEFLGFVVSTDESTASIAHQSEENGNAVIDVAGKYDIYFKSEMDVWTLYMHEYVEPAPFAWGIAGNKTGWELDGTHKFIESTPEGDALYTYKTDYTFAEGDEWKVTNTKGEWVNNVEGVVGIDYVASTFGAFECFEGNIKVKIAGDYTVTLNIFDKAEKDPSGVNFISGVQIIAVKKEGPGPTPVDPTAVTIDQTSPVTVENGKTENLSATLAPAGATGTLVWSSDAPEIVSVDTATGVVTGHVDSGSATISVTVQGFETLVDSITVNAAPNSFAWGLAGSFSDWKLDTDHKFTEVSKQGDAIYTYQGEYTFAVNDEWKVTNTNNEWVSNAEGVGFDFGASTAGAFENAEGNIKVKTAGTYVITLNIFEDAKKDEGGNFYSGVQIIAIDKSAPTEFMWGIAGSATDWKLDTEHPFVESTKEGDALFTYKLTGYEFAENATWKVTNTKGEWVNNQSGVGFDSTKSTADAFAIDEGNIKVLVAGTYDITLNLWECTFDDKNIIAGAQIYAVKQDVPGPTPTDPTITFGVANPKVEVGKDLEIPVTATLCSDITYSVTAGDTFVQVVSASSNDAKLVVHGLLEGAATITATASNGTISTIDVTCIKEELVDRDYTVKLCRDGEWSLVDMSQTPDDDSQYECTADFKAGDIFVVHMDGDTWYHFTDVKLGCISYVSLDGTENIKFNADGNYTIYADYDADTDGKHIWIKKNIAPATMTIEGSAPVTMDVNESVEGEFKLIGVELETNEFFSFEYDGITVGYDNLKSDSPAGVKSNTAKHIAVTEAGKYDIYFETTKMAGECLYIAKHVETVTYTITFNDGWIFNDGAKIFAWVWSTSTWVECTRVGSTNQVTIEVAGETTGFTFVRASSTTTVSTVGWPDDGKSWNKSPDFPTTSSVLTYDWTWNWNA